MKEAIIISDDVISNKIYFIRDKKVMIDSDLAQLYSVETKQLKRQVRRNIERFPEDFMFELTEREILRSQIGTQIGEEIDMSRWHLQNKVLLCYRVC